MRGRIIRRDARRVRRVPRQLPPDGVARSYLRALLRGPIAYLAQLAQEELLPLLEEEPETERKDAEPSDIDAALKRIARRWMLVFSDQVLRDMTEDVGEKTSEFQREQLRRQFSAAAGFDPALLEPWLPDAINEFTSENVDLIKTIPERFLEGVRETVLEGVREGRRPETLKKQLQHELGVSEWNARRIARDQVSKFNAHLNQERQEELGVGSYIWRTVGDNRVRDRHAHLNGQRFKWSQPPIINDKGERGHPGDDILCRCYAEPDLSELLGI